MKQSISQSILRYLERSMLVRLTQDGREFIRGLVSVALAAAGCGIFFDALDTIPRRVELKMLVGVVLFLLALAVLYKFFEGKTLTRK